MRRLLVAALLLVPALPLAAKDTAPAVPPEVAGKVAEAIAALDDPSFAVREDATRALLALGPAAIPALTPALSHPSPEVRRRVRRVLLRYREAERRALMGFPAPSDWPALKRGPDRGAAAGADAPVHRPSLAWFARLPAEVGAPWFDAPLLAAGGRIYAVTRSGTVAALAAGTGEVVWTTETGEPVFASPVLAGGALYVPGRSLTALDAETGAERWRWRTDYGVSAPALVDGGRVFAVERGERLAALDPVTGEVQWAVRLPATTAAPVVVGDIVVAGTEEGVGFYAVENGSRRWFVPTESPVTLTPAVLPDRIVVADAGRTITALSVARGERLWRRRIPEGRVVETPVVYGDALFFSTNGATLRALRASDGTDLWTRFVGCAVQSSPCAAEGLLFLTAGSIVHAYECTEGDDVWFFLAPEGLSSPILVDGTLYVATMDGFVAAYR